MSGSSSAKKRPLAIVAAAMDDDLRAAALAAGIDEYIVKPFEAPKLAEAIERADRDPLIHVPIGVGKLHQHRLHDWGYDTEVEPGLGGRAEFYPRHGATG